MMHLLINFTVLTLIVGIFSPVSAFAAKSNDIFYDLKSPHEQSVQFVRLSDGKVLYEISADRLLIPASVTKVVTAAAALTRWGPNHTFKTRFFYNGRRDEQTIHGDLIVVGNGDPFLVNELLWQWAADLRNMGIRSITGDIIIDNSLFDAEVRDDSRRFSVKSSSHAYDAPVSAFGLNFNTFAVAVAASGRPGSKAMINIDPYPLKSLDIQNRTNTARSGKPTIQVSRVSPNDDSSALVARGAIAVDQPIMKVYRSVRNTTKISGEILRSFLNRHDITVKGQVRNGHKPTQAKLLYTLEGYNMARIVAGLNKFSNNYIGDMLVKRLGAAFPASGTADASGQGTMENGVQVLKAFMQKDVGILDPFTLINGSGLDHDNRFNATQIVKVLTFMHKRFDLFPEFLVSLPTAGLDGTLAKRFNGNQAKSLDGMVRAKTGTLTEPVAASSLAGYLHHPKHGLVAFAILENGLKNKAHPTVADFRDRQDDALYKFLNQF